MPLATTEPFETKPSLNNIKEFSPHIKEHTKHSSITKINWLMLFKQITPVYNENHTKAIYEKCSY
jgi:hypothetical protein